MALGETDTRLDKPVNIGGVHVRGPKRADRVIALLISHDEYDVGL